jgi:hypothetical protein
MDMDAIDPLVKALIDLCEREGDIKNVADKAKVSADNLWQIINGTKLPSGNPRGVGPGLRGKLSAAYPDWLTPRQSLPPVIKSPAPPIAATVLAMAEAVSYLSTAERAELLDQLKALLLDPASAPIQSRIVDTLMGASGHLPQEARRKG